MAVNQEKLGAFLGKAVGDMGGAISAPLVLIGDKLGLYKAMAGAGPITSAELAQKTGTNERYVREWLCAQAAGGYVEYESTTGSYMLPDEQALVLADETGPAFLPGAFEIIASMFFDEARMVDAFRTGEGVGWHEHNCNLFRGTERFFRPGYNANLVNSWIPAMDGVHEMLSRGGRVADVGCGFGASTIIMAQAYPKAEFFGFDYHEPSIVAARSAADEAGVADRVQFEVDLVKELSRRQLRSCHLLR